MELRDKKERLMRYRLLAARARGVLDAGNTELASELASCAELLRVDLIDTLAMIEDERIRSVMSLRYVHGLDWDTIAERMYFSKRWALKLHKRGLESL